MTGITRKSRPISHQRLIELVDYDRKTGFFSNRKPRPGTRHQFLGHVESNGYRRLMIEGRRYQASQLAWFYVTGKWSGLDIDHKNLNRDDNWFDNLRPATVSQNHANMPLRKGGTSGLKGAHFNRFRGYWQSYIVVNGRNIWLGRFDNKEAAHAAYCLGAKKYFGEFARTA